MNTSNAPSIGQPRFELRYRLSAHRCSYAFPCDCSGNVNVDCLSDRARENYFYACSMVGGELRLPQILLSVF